MLFKTVNEIKDFLPIGAGNDFNRLKPHIGAAENKYIKPLLGTAMYDELQEFFEADYPAEPTEAQVATKNLLEKVQLALINLAYFFGFDLLNASVSDAGFQRIESDMKKGLYKYQEDNVKQYFSDTGFNALDDVLVYIEENIAYFSDFKSETNWTVLKQAFLPTVKVIEAIPYNIHGSRLIFLALQPQISFIEDTTIKTTLGETIYETVKTEMAKDSPDETTIALLPYIRKPLIYFASAMLMEETGATLENRGLFFEKTEPIFRGSIKKEPSSLERTANMVARNRGIGNIYLEQLKSYLSENWKTDYSGQTGSVFSRDNTGKKTFFA